MTERDKLVYKLGMLKMSKIINNAIKESDIIKRTDSKYLMGRS